MVTLAPSTGFPTGSTTDMSTTAKTLANGSVVECSVHPSVNIEPTSVMPMKMFFMVISPWTVRHVRGPAECNGVESGAKKRKSLPRRSHPHVQVFSNPKKSSRSGPANPRTRIPEFRGRTPKTAVHPVRERRLPYGRPEGWRPWWRVKPGRASRPQTWAVTARWLPRFVSPCRAPHASEASPHARRQPSPHARPQAEPRLTPPPTPIIPSPMIKRTDSPVQHGWWWWPTGEECAVAGS
jgi:hypothetical protein